MKKFDDEDFDEKMERTKPPAKRLKESVKIEDLKQLRSILPAERFVITGSLALSLHGFDVPVNDIDIILSNPSEAALEQLARLQLEFPTVTQPYRQDLFMFKWNDTKVDIFINKLPENTKLQWEGFDVASVAHITQAKKEIGRLKDWIQLRNLSRMLCKSEDFRNHINNVKL